ncbi:hypothetical protein [uncultured Desulfobacter sp.]|uniref:HAMP domain-containing protein n=1 Tax=uncultured Desulfobacter sp. TaxID=240139 RepID=UPI002AA6B39C|nr:hypothetical protein [uncultured Desulfobacter sp.]
MTNNFIAGTGSKDSPRPVSKIFKFNGRNMFGTVVDMDETGWKILIAQPVRKAFQSLWNILTLIGLGLFLALIFSLFIGQFLAGKFSFAVESYIMQASSIADGDYDLQWPEHKTKEFSLLGQSFKRMVQKINKREEELRQMSCLTLIRTKASRAGIKCLIFYHHRTP